MKTLNLVQGSPEWIAHRANSNNASDAPAMMGVSKYKTRDQLLKERATGFTADVSPHTQKLFDRGHAAEAAVRPKIEALIGEELYPVTGVSDEYPRLSASFDGIDMAEEIGLEVKLLNTDLVAQVKAGELTDAHYYTQIEQQILIGKLKKVVFVTSNEDASEFYHMDYFPVPGRAEAIVAGWAQFEKDLAAYVHVEPAAPVVATPVMSLPAVSVQIEGALQVLSNLPEFGDRLRSFIAEMNPTPETDQDFADAENEIKELKRAEVQLDAAEDNALAQIAVVDEMRRLKAMLKDMARDNRLARERLVKDRKELVRVKIQQDAHRAITSHIAAINERHGRAYMPNIAYDLATAMKNKRTVESLKGAAADEVARTKIEADRIAKIIDANLATLREKAADHKFLFNDTGSLVLKDPEAVVAIVAQRIAEHDAAEAKKAEALAEAAREKIRREEQAKAEAAAKLKADAERREREQAEAAEIAEAARKASEAMAVTLAEVTPPAVVEVAPQAPPAVVPSIVDDQVREITQAAKPAGLYTAPPAEQIVDAVAQRFGVPKHIAAGWLLTMNVAELAKVAA